jgi:hypothetical protein
MMCNKVPFEIIDLIADYHDYEKYCKPKHYKIYKHVLSDLNNIFKLFNGFIPPSIVYTCWGPGWTEYIYTSNDNIYDDIESIDSYS